MYIKQKSGISLIILAVTIVVMLILSGVMITSMDISTENADFSVFVNDIAQLQESARAMYILEEKLPIADNAIKISRSDIFNLVSSDNQTLFEEELNSNGESENAYFYILDLAKAGAGEVEYGTGADGADDVYVISVNSLKVYYLKGVEYDGSTYFSINSKIADIVNLPDTTLDESSLDITVRPLEPQKPEINLPTTYYGQKVTNYKTGNTAIDNQVEWQIFYADTNNIYLIATDYVHYDLLPKKKVTVNGVETVYALNKVSDYKAHFKDILPAYNGSEDITDARLQTLNKSYHEYLTENNTTSQNENMKAVAYMLDINIWDTFAGVKAEYAIGGPTVEMFMKSYSQKYSSDGIDYRAQATSVEGYQISKDGGANWSYFYDKILNTSDTQYVINSTTKASYMWISSPSSFNTSSIMCVFTGGTVMRRTYNKEELGFRPIVCLKSSVNLKQVDGGFAII